MLCRILRPPAAPHFPAVRALCLGFIRPRCTYAFAFWTPTERQMRQMQAAFLLPLQRSMCLPSSSHHLGALVEAHCPSFEALRTQAAARFLLRSENLLRTHPSHPTSQALRSDRANTARQHCLAHRKNCTPVTTYVEQTAMPHLISQVLAHLPTLAPLHPLMTRYFPRGENLPCPLPISLTIEEVNSLTMVDTHREWRDGRTLARVSISTAPLLTIRTSPVPSLFLKVESNPMAAIRARIRANRIPTQHRRYHMRPPQTDDPSCTHAACRIGLPAPLDTMDHILIHCPRHDAARLVLSSALRTKLNYTAPLTLAFVSGEVLPFPKRTTRQHATAVAYLALTATFITQVMHDRAAADSTLKTFMHEQAANPVPL